MLIPLTSDRIAQYESKQGSWIGVLQSQKIIELLKFVAYWCSKFPAS